MNLEGLKNTRDLGGYRTKEGGEIREKRILRSGALCVATQADLQLLVKECGLKTIVDFRTLTERSQKPDPELSGVQYIINEILQEAQMGITHENENRPTELVAAMIAMCREVGEDAIHYLDRLYPLLVTNANCIQGYRSFFDIVCGQKEGTLLYHCSEGKDRVGTATALLFSALGVEKEVILEDYLLTNRYTEERRRAVYEQIRERIPQEPEIAERFLILNSVHRSYMESVFAVIDQTYGSMEVFLREQMGLSNDRLNDLRENYLK